MQAVGGLTPEQQSQVVDLLDDLECSTSLANFHLLGVPVLVPKAVCVHVPGECLSSGVRREAAGIE